MINIQKYYFETETPTVRNAINDFKNEMGDIGRCLTLEALYHQLWECEGEINRRYVLYQTLTDEDAIYLEKSIVVFSIPSLEKKVDSLKMRIRLLVIGVERKIKNTITPDMIIRAREYSMYELLGGYKKGNYLCIAHEERHPSMGVKNNRARCFSCGYSGDSIDIKMLIENCDFIDAVRRLQ